MLGTPSNIRFPHERGFFTRLHKKNTRMKTFAAKAEDIDRKWWIVDAKDQVLGQLAVQVANVLRGKNKPTFTPHVDTGDFVIVVNAEKVRLTGNKLKAKQYQRHSGTPGGFRATPYEQLVAEKPAFVIEKAVRGMLPKNPLGRKMGAKLKVYAGANHPHAAQKPEALSL